VFRIPEPCFGTPLFRHLPLARQLIGVICESNKETKVNIKDAMNNLKGLTDNELLALKKQTQAMPWSIKKAGALTLIQAEIERRLATRNPAHYTMKYVELVGCIAVGTFVGLEAGEALKNI